ncbi:MAG: DUF4860 domain-containing protein [Lachnospiraceae bacterium]
MERKKHSIDVLFMFVLFAVFAILSVLIIFIGSGVYSRITENKVINEQTRTTLSYIANKVRETDGIENIYLTEKEGSQVLVLKAEYEDYAADTWIYEYDSKLMEMTVDSGDEFELRFGDVLLDTDGVEFYIDEEEKLLKVSIFDKNAKESKVSIYLEHIIR